MKTPAVTELPAWLREMPGAGARAELDIEGFLPRPFAAYCRILNPARSVAGDRLLWRDVRENADAVDGATQWADIHDSAQRHEALYLDPVMGGLDSEVAEVLSGILSRHTGTAERVAYLAWEGYADLDERYRSAGTVWAPYGRKMHLLQGTLAEASSAASAHQDAPLWWVPSDGSWCVGNDIYARSVYVGGSRDCIQEILENHDLEGYPVRPEQKVVAEDY